MLMQTCKALCFAVMAWAVTGAVGGRWNPKTPTWRGLHDTYRRGVAGLGRYVPALSR